jgi:23S rRNA pseudouridine1911/1915/1917 synthase
VYGGKRVVAPQELPVGRALARFSRQALHAEKLRVSHVRSGRSMSFTAPLSDDFVALLRVCERSA